MHYHVLSKNSASPNFGTTLPTWLKLHLISANGFPNITSLMPNFENIFGTVPPCSRDTSQSVREVGEVGDFQTSKHCKAHRLLAKAVSEFRCTGLPWISLQQLSTDI